MEGFIAAVLERQGMRKYTVGGTAVDLQESRKQIDEIDRQLVDLMTRRLDLMEKVADYKGRHGLPVLHEEREQQVVEQVLTHTPKKYEDGMRMLYGAMFDICRDQQYRRLAGETQLTSLVRSAREEEIQDREGLKIVCQGVEGAYAHIAARTVFQKGTIRFVKTWKEIFQQVEQGEADYGVLPIENSTAGSVNEVYDLMSRHQCYIAKGVKLRINHCLVACKGVKKEEITQVASHPQALSQCSNYIEELGASPQPVRNTAVAAETVAREGSRHTAAIASQLTAQLYGLEILDSAIQNAGNNYTRFIVISKELMVSPKADRISLSMAIPHVAGSLNRVLMRFASYGLNLTKLESRPIPGTNFEFQFYFDLEGSVREKKVLVLMEYLSQIFPSFHFLGNYEQISSNGEEARLC